MASTQKRTAEELSSPEEQKHAKKSQTENDRAINCERKTSTCDDIAADIDKLAMEKLELMFTKIQEDLHKLKDLPQEIEGLKFSIDTALKKSQVCEKNLNELKLTADIQGATIKFLENKVAQLSDKVIKQEAYSRKNNLIFSGIVLNTQGKSPTTRQCIDKIMDILVTGLKIADARESIVIEGAHENMGGKFLEGSFCKDIIVKFNNFQDRMKVWYARKALNKTQFKIREDFPKEYKIERQILQPVCTQAIQNGHNAYLSENKLSINKVTYSVKTLHQLPPDLALSAGNPTIHGVIPFFGYDNPLSNFYPSKILIEGQEYATPEHYYQFKKAEFCEEDVIAHKILKSDDSAYAVKLGKKLTVPKAWEEVMVETMHRAIHTKFTQHEHLKRCLISTKTSLLAEGNPKCKFWSAGLKVDEILTLPPDAWPGVNMLGKILMEVRKSIVP